MTHITPQDTFRTLLSFLKSEPINWLMVPLAVPSLGTEEGRDHFTNVAPIAIRIMESGIFYNGGLKGTDFPGNGLDYESYPIKDLEQFIYDLAYALQLYEVGSAGYPSDFQQYSFSEGMRHLKMFVSGVRWYKGKRAAKKMKKALGILAALVRDTETIKDLSPGFSKSAIKKEIKDIFCDYIKAPGIIMADRAAELLNTFDISASPEGMRDYFKGK